MTVENIKFGQVVQAVVIILVASFLVQVCVSLCYGVARAVQIYADLDPDATEEEQEDIDMDKDDDGMDFFNVGSAEEDTMISELAADLSDVDLNSLGELTKEISQYISGGK